MRYIATAFAAALLLGGCSAASPQIDRATGTTKAQRCVDYRGFLATALAVQANKPSEDRAARIAYYKAFIAANCGDV